MDHNSSNPDATGSPLIVLLRSLDLIEKEEIVPEKISRVVLFEEDLERSFLIPFFCDCVIDSFYGNEPVYEDLKDCADAKDNEYYRILQKSFRFAKLICECNQCKNEDLKGFYIYKINENEITDWFEYGPVIQKIQCRTCSGVGSLEEIEKSMCKNCSGSGFILDKQKKDAHLCNKCGGHREIQKIINKTCIDCEGLGFLPKVGYLQFSDVDPPVDTSYIQYGKYRTPYNGDLRIPCISCDGTSVMIKKAPVFYRSYTPDEWKSLAIVKLGYLRFTTESEIDSRIDYETLIKIESTNKNCIFFEPFWKCMKSCLEKMGHLNHDDIIFNFDASHSPAMSKNEKSFVNLSVSIETICSVCEGYGTLGIPFPGADALAAQFGTPRQGLIRIYRCRSVSIA
jgi:hypothetical protein